MKQKKKARESKRVSLILFKTSGNPAFKRKAWLLRSENIKKGNDTWLLYISFYLALWVFFLHFTNYRLYDISPRSICLFSIMTCIRLCQSFVMYCTVMYWNYSQPDLAPLELWWPAHLKSGCVESIKRIVNWQSSAVLKFAFVGH